MLRSEILKLKKKAGVGFFKDVGEHDCGKLAGLGHAFEPYK